MNLDPAICCIAGATGYSKYQGMVKWLCLNKMGTNFYKKPHSLELTIWRFDFMDICANDYTNFQNGIKIQSAIGQIVSSAYGHSQIVRFLPLYQLHCTRDLIILEVRLFDIDYIITSLNILPTPHEMLSMARAILYQRQKTG